MNEDEYSKWREWSVADYAKSLAETGRYSEEDALTQSEKEFSDVINGLSEQDNHLFTAENISGTPIGTIWYTTENPEYAFILDFAVYEEYRQMGYGCAILTELERNLKSIGIPSVALHVFENNIAAIKLYEKCGFTQMKSDNADAGSLYMGKTLNCEL